MGKYLGYFILVVLVIFALEWFEIVDIPFLEIPDYLTGKEDFMQKTSEALEQNQ